MLEAIFCCSDTGKGLERDKLRRIYRNAKERTPILNHKYAYDVAINKPFIFKDFFCFFLQHVRHTFATYNRSSCLPDCFTLPDLLKANNKVGRT